MSGSGRVPPGRWFALVVALAVFLGVAFGYWVYASLS
jgi:hypothetical protein